uniref:Ferritin n=1 Tax=Monopterus albus TaxID=43700 RepID=A0A3Q3ISN9_MONAL
MSSQIRQNLHPDCEAAINTQLNLELYASYIYLSMKPDRDEWGSGLEALECALQLEKSVNQSLLDLQKMATEHSDPHMCKFIEIYFLDEQVKSIKQLADWMSNLRHMGAPQSGMAEYLFDRHTLAEEDS